jgi:transcriptional regulator with XRE-family HTH domain
MGVLEIVAEQRLGVRKLAAHPVLRSALRRVEQSARSLRISKAEKARIASIVELCFEYEREADPDEKQNILRTLEEISDNQPVDLPTKAVDEWDEELKAAIPAYARAARRAERRTGAFLSKYFSLRARAGLKTQQSVAKKSGLRRSYIAVIESGDHFPQQKTLQKLARAFGVDVSELLR